MPILTSESMEEQLLESMRQWAEKNVLDCDMYKHLVDIEKQKGKRAASQRVRELLLQYMTNELGYEVN